jgi:hypothetical protein
MKKGTLSRPLQQQRWISVPALVFGASLLLAVTVLASGPGSVQQTAISKQAKMSQLATQATAAAQSWHAPKSSSPSRAAAVTTRPRGPAQSSLFMGVTERLPITPHLSFATNSWKSDTARPTALRSRLTISIGRTGGMSRASREAYPVLSCPQQCKRAASIAAVAAIASAVGLLGVAGRRCPTQSGLRARRRRHAG